MDPIAIIGMSCRFPGAPGIDAYWQLLCEGRDAVRDVPAERWDLRRYLDEDRSAPGKMYTGRGGFLEQVDQFDPEFFGIAPREAVRMDPQQRLLLELSWEAFEDAGIPVESRAGSPTGVFVGFGVLEYSLPQLMDPRLIDGYTNTGYFPCIMANRISYVFDLRGPSLSIDTACSSSLTAVHQACQSLASGECTLALAGGVSLMLSPASTIGFCKLSALSPDGNCKTFDARANGYVRGEGAGIVVLKPLAAALAEGDFVYAVIRGSGVNQDGRSNGLTAPNRFAQEAVLRRAYAQARISPGQVRYVEAHGTGTLLGDPIEVLALGEVLSEDRPAGQPCALGSVKTNIGHLEAAAGIAGLIKTALVLRHGLIPPSLHFQTPNPHIPFERLPVRVQQTLERLPAGEGPAIAGVSAFGFGGANAHVVLEQAPPVETQSPTLPAGELACQLLPLSARSENGLRELARAYEQQLSAEMPDEPANSTDEAHRVIALRAVCYNASVRRSHHPYRLTVSGENSAELAGHLRAYLQGAPPRHAVSEGKRRATRPKIAFLFTGQGSQYVGMGKALWDAFPRFRDTVLACDDFLRPLLGPSLSALLCDEKFAPSQLESTAVTQPVLFALEYALAEMWRACGVEPDAVLGHSLGEYVAACVAGVFSWQDGLRLVTQRAQWMQALAGHGAMMAVLGSEDEVRPLLESFHPHTTIAAVNGPRQVVVSGDLSAIESLYELLRAKAIPARRLPVSHAFHSPQMDGMLTRLESLAGQIPHAPPRCRLISNLTGAAWRPDEYSPGEYWRRHAQEPVQFEAGVRGLRESGCDVFVEIGPGAALLSMARQCLVDDAILWQPSLRRGAELRQFLETFGALYCRGVRTNWRTLYSAPCPKVALPQYPFQRRRFWLDAAPPAVDQAGETAQASASAGRHEPCATLLGARVPGALPVFQSELSLDRWPALADHDVAGAPLFPATGYLALAAAAASALSGRSVLEVSDVSFATPLILAPHAVRVVQTILMDDVPADVPFRVASRDDTNLPADGVARWTRNASGHVHLGAAGGRSTGNFGSRWSLAAARQACPEFQPAADHYAALQRRGLRYGGAFQCLSEIWRGAAQAVGRILPPRDPAFAGGGSPFDPAVLDACLQLVAAALPADADVRDNEPHVPVHIARFVLLGSLDGPAWCHVVIPRSQATAGDAIVADLAVFRDSGEILAEVTGLILKRVPRERMRRAEPAAVDEGPFSIRWRPCPQTDTGEGLPHGSWLLFADRGSVARQFASRLRESGQPVTLIVRGEESGCPGEAVRKVDPDDAADFERCCENLWPADATPPCIVFFWGLDVADADSNEEQDLLAEQQRTTGTLLLLLRTLATRSTNRANVWVVTRGGQATGEEPSIAARQAPLWGLMRTAAWEFPQWQLGRIDLDPADCGEQGALISTAISLSSQENELACRRGRWLVPRLVNAQLSPSLDTEDARLLDPSSPSSPEVTSPPLAIPVGEARRLEVRERGLLDQLEMHPRSRSVPGPGELEIRVEAAGLNFRDVLNALGMYPGDAGPLGGECAGFVSAVGEGVTGWEPGQRVMALAAGSFGDYVTTPAALAVVPPRAWNMAEAATVPIPFLTADYALREVARLQAGERILIHAAAGGVGLAAVQRAQILGAEVFATAGSPAKRAFLRENGVRHVLNSRSLDFADQLRELTHGEGVDVVLNSLRGEFIPRSLDTLRTGGRFVEIGKSDDWSEARASEYKPDVTYRRFDLLEIAHSRPEQVREMLRRIVEDGEHGRLWPLPRRDFPLLQARDAFRYMAQARHIGKIVLLVQQPGAEFDPVARTAPTDQVPSRPEIMAEATYLVTGGLGGLGLLIAQWLVDRGARHLVLLSRQPPGDHARARLLAWRQKGITALVRQADVTRRDELDSLWYEIRRSGPPLRGVFHAAGVLHDGLLVDQTWGQLAEVLAPKLCGATHLDELCRGDELDFFVLFSSVAAVLGSPGQANYAAANAYLDALAHERRRLGLPALSINWGPWADVGMAARAVDAPEPGPERSDAGRRSLHAGLVSLPAARGLELLGLLIASDEAQAVAADVDWAALLARFEGRSIPGLLHDVAERIRGSSAARARPRVDWRAELRGLEPAERSRALTERLRGEAARVLGASDSLAIDPRRPLAELGMDSLMAVEMRNLLMAAVGCPLPTTLLFDRPTLEGLAQFLLEQMFPGELPTSAGETPPALPTSTRPPAGGRDESEQELARQLAEKLATLRQGRPT